MSIFRQLIGPSSAVSTMSVPVNAEQAERASREALAALNWLMRETRPGFVQAGEDPAQLCCTIWPVEVRIAIEAQGERSAISVEATTPGQGVIQTRQLRDRLRLLEYEISIRMPPAASSR